MNKSLFDTQGRLTQEGYALMEKFFEAADPIFSELVEECEYNVTEVSHLLIHVAIELEKNNI